MVFFVLCIHMTVKAVAMLDADIAPGATYHEYVDFTPGPLVCPDLYTGGAYITGTLADGTVIHVKGGVPELDVINTYLSPVLGTSVSRTNVHVGQNNPYGYIEAPFNGNDHHIQTS